MYKKRSITAVIPAYNEEKLITKTVETLPDFVDKIVLINDGSSDDTLKIITDLAKKNKKLVIVNNTINLGLGTSMVKGFKKALALKTDLICVLAGDAQCDPSYLSKMADELMANDLDYVKANRFVHLEELKKMPKMRKFGNIIITILTKFSTGYYNIFDSQNGYAVFTREILEKLSLSMVGKRYDYENTLLTALSIAGARVRDYPVPAVYGEETSTIKVLPTTIRALRVTFTGFWKRIYNKYILINFHPIALFLLSGIFLIAVGLLAGIFITIERALRGASPSSGTVMLVVLPIIVGFQLLLTAFTMDMNNEDK